MNKLTLKKLKQLYKSPISEAWCHMPVIPELWKTEVAGTQVQDQFGQYINFSKTSSQNNKQERDSEL